MAAELFQAVTAKGMVSMENIDWILLVLSFAEGAPLTPPQIQKALFLIQHELGDTQSERPTYLFVPYLHGPYAPEVNIDAYDLVMLGFAQTTRSPQPATTYSMTMSGSLRALALRCDIGVDAVKRAQRIVSWVRGTALSVVVQEIAKQFPQYQPSATALRAAV